MTAKQTHLLNLEDYRILVATWIMSCNDQIPMMTYKGIAKRLDVNEQKVISLIKEYPELFRQRTPNSITQFWKDQMKTGNLLPAWIRDIDTNIEREKAIQELTSDDIFRSQFRTKRDSPASEMEILKWGLEYLKSMRDINNDQLKERRDVRNQATTLIITAISSFLGLLISIASLVVNSGK
ncbi:hypothetical protein E7T09_15500 [Deinococcus sp. KSM4-11]|uniref:hypothetical protein n=1 Tax=Deinococcus sp. KSM4-11 TaxID=2568654 RepID=UPI0010A306F6|nr:hypothetical protein [Deinococcus sp. KSM4-11]THF85911.1 hypothetical protein E7T09_15500 [Deinococcus sp. KSM4-11]